MNKISVCTVSMNRLFHIRETLPANIRENSSFPNIEFVLLDYNSADGLENWVQSNMIDYIKSGVLKYYKTREPAYFDISHAKNMVFRLSSADILCMIDADHFAGLDYACWINSVFVSKGNNSLVVASEFDGDADSDLGGKLAFHRDLFIKARGFDEALTGYGLDDIDLINRLHKAGGEKVIIKDREHRKFIRHSNVDRLKNYYLAKHLDNMYIQVNDTIRDRIIVLYLMNDDFFYQVTYEFEKIKDKKFMSSIGGWYVDKDGYVKGRILRGENSFLLKAEETTQYREEADQSLTSFSDNQKIVWKRIDKSSDMYMKLLLAHSSCLNLLRYVENNEQQNLVNPLGWGKGTVYSNFDYSHPINVS